MGRAGLLRTGPLAPSATLRLVLGRDLYAAVPAGQARALASLVRLALREIGRRDGIAPPPHLTQTLAVLEEVDQELVADLTGACGSEFRTAEPAGEAVSAVWPHDGITVADAAELTGWSPSYLCRLGRRGLGRKEAGAWRLDRAALLELLAERQAAA